MVLNNPRGMWKEDRNLGNDSVLMQCIKMTEEESLYKNQKEETPELPSRGSCLVITSQTPRKWFCNYSVQGISFLFVSLTSVAQFCCWPCYEQDWTTAVNMKWKKRWIAAITGAGRGTWCKQQQDVFSITGISITGQPLRAVNGCKALEWFSHL